MIGSLMERSLRTFLALTLMLVLGLSYSAAEQDTEETAAEIGMTDTMRYTPEAVTIQKGETVLWRNTSQMPHTVTLDPELAKSPDSVNLPPDAEPFHSGELQPGETFSHTFDVAGEYTYFCTLHEQFGMIGHLTVIDPEEADE